ncbi:MAG: S49 family peptidase [Phycisphaeraceae bacterium]
MENNSGPDTPSPTPSPLPPPRSESRAAINPAGIHTPPPPPPGMSGGYGYYAPPPMPPRRGGIMQRLVTGLVGSLMLISIALNIWLGLFFLSSMSVGPIELPYQEGDSRHRIVILPIRGTIDSGMAEYVRKALLGLRANRPAAVILRVESGGGGVGASDRIWHELVQFKADTGVPIVTSFGDVAASGGYYIAAPTDWIIAEPSTITGSIGVMLMDFSVEKLMEKIGVQPTILTATKSTEKTVANNPFRDWNEQDTQAVQPLLDSMQVRFADIVFQGRSKVVAGLTRDDVDKAATGKVFMTDEAIALKLVDDPGYLGDAITKAKALGKIAAGVTPQVTQLSEGHGLLSRLGVSHQPAPWSTSLTPEQARSWLTELSTPGIEYRWQPGQ